MQPLDAGVFRTIKAEWKKLLSNIFKDNGFRYITKPMFPTLLILVVNKGLKSENDVSGFKVTGILPLNQERIIPKLNLGIALNVQVEGPFIANTQAISAEALTLPTFNTPTLFFSPAKKRLSRCVQSNLPPISAVKCQNKEELKNLFDNHLKELTQCTN